MMSGAFTRRIEKLESAAGAAGQSVRVIFDADLEDGQPPAALPGQRMFHVRFVTPADVAARRG